MTFGFFDKIFDARSARMFKVKCADRQQFLNWFQKEEQKFRRHRWENTKKHNNNPLVLSTLRKLDVGEMGRDIKWKRVRQIRTNIVFD